MKKLPLLALLFLLTFVDSAFAINPEGFRKYIDYVQAMARRKGVKESTLHEAFRDVKLNYKVITLDTKQPERKTKADFQSYKNRVVSKDRINEAKKVLQRNYALLHEIERKFGVEKEVLVALWAVETAHGSYMGDFDVINSLATLAYEGRRREFFEDELIKALQILQQRHVTKSGFKGSWAGAFGQFQFMPSTFLSHAFDYDGDGKKDIWYNNGDAIASAANYLNNIDWVGGIGWGKRVTLPVTFRQSYVGYKQAMYKWRQLGLEYADGSWLPNDSYDTTLIVIDGDVNEAYLVTENFDKIKEWNRSTYFATSIGLIAEAIKN